MSHRTRRLSTLAAVAALTLSLLTAGAPAQAHPAGDRAVGAGAAWLEGQLTDGLVVGTYGDFVYTDHGLTADIAFALDAVGGHDAAVGAIADAVAPVVKDWYDSYGTVYTGSAAKAAVLAQVAGRDATAFGGHDLQAVVEGNVATAPPITGRVQNVGETDWQTQEPADSLNVISQGWAARGLAVQGSALADEVEAFLLDQQCDAGFFRFALTSDKTAPEQGCVEGVDVGHLDSTALTVINLLAVPTPSADVSASVEQAISWLKTQQRADGSFTAGGTEGVNANTTGLAAWALGEVGETEAASRAAAWLRTVQVADLAPCATGLTAENGAVAFNPEALASSRNAGAIKIELQDQYRRTTAQALPALAHVPAGGSALALKAPATAAEKSSVTVTVSGLGAGEAGCVTLGAVAKPVTGTGGDVAVSFDLPAGAATHTFRLVTLGGVLSASTAAQVPVPMVPAPLPGLGELQAKKVVKVRKNVFRLPISCAGGTTCEGKLKVRTAQRVRTVAGKKARKVVIAKKSYSVAPGDTERVRLKVRRPVRAVLAGGRVKVKAVQSAPGLRRTVTKFWLRKTR